jgi:hypothetical protein
VVPVPVHARRPLGGYLVLVLLVGFAGGLALGSVAAARRTQSAFPDYLASTNPSAPAEAGIERILPSGFPVEFYLASLTEAKAERAIKPESIALAVFGGIQEPATPASTTAPCCPPSPGASAVISISGNWPGSAALHIVMLAVPDRPVVNVPAGISSR